MNQSSGKVFYDTFNEYAKSNSSKKGRFYQFTVVQNSFLIHFKVWSASTRSSIRGYCVLLMRLLRQLKSSMSCLRWLMMCVETIANILAACVQTKDLFHGIWKMLQNAWLVRLSRWRRAISNCSVSCIIHCLLVQIVTTTTRRRRLEWKPSWPPICNHCLIFYTLA